MDCRDYIQNYVAAHADRELNAEERRGVEEHLAGCARCRVRLASERELKALIKSRLRRATAPGELRAAIHARLDHAEDGIIPAGLDLAIARQLRRPAVWAPIAALAMVLVLVIAMRGRTPREASVPDFDVAIAKFTAFEKHFEPNVPSDSYASIGEHYHSARMPGYIWNFEPLGYHLVGGRIDPLPNGSPATYTFYRGASGAVMCTRFHVDRLVIPPGGHLLREDQYVYSYRGFTLVLSVDEERQWVCILMSREPEKKFAREIEFLES